MMKLLSSISAGAGRQSTAASKAKFPRGNSAWPAFRLKMVNQFTGRSETGAEIDIIQAYGANDWSGYHAAVHLWPAHSSRPDELQKHSWKGCYERVLGDMFDSRIDDLADMQIDYLRVWQRPEWAANG